MAKKAAAIAPSMEEDVALTPEEQAKLDAEGGEQAPEQPPAEEAQPETQGLQPIAEEPKAKPAKKHEETVAYERFSEINERLRATEAQLADAATYRERWARLEERQKQAQEAAQAEYQRQIAAQQAAERPDPNLDPVGARAYDANLRAWNA